MNYTEKNTLENKVENILLNEIKKNPRDIETIKTYALCKQAFELENIRGILWDIKHLLVIGKQQNNMDKDNQQRIDKATAELKEAFSDKLQVKFKKLHPDARTPIRATDGAAGWDLTSTGFSFVKKDEESKLYGYTRYYTDLVRYHTEIAVEIPPGYVGLLFPRSSCYKQFLTLANCVGVIDSDYRGEICFIYRETNSREGEFREGDRIGQLVILPCPSVEMVEVEELSQTKRGVGGFGSTGK